MDCVLTTDSSGNSRTLTNNNTVGETADGKYGYAADYGDPNTNKTFSRSEDIWANGALSFACWVKRGNGTDTHGFFSCNEATTDKQLGGTVGSTSFAFKIFRVGVGYDTVSASVTAGTDWHHYAMTLTTGAGGTMKIYYDGVEKNSGSVTDASGTTGQADLYQIGHYDGAYMEGYQDDVAFFSDVLTGREIAELASEPSGGFFYMSV